MVLGRSSVAEMRRGSGLFWPYHSHASTVFLGLRNRVPVSLSFAAARKPNMTISGDYRPPEAPLKRRDQLDPRSTGMWVGVVFATPCFYAALDDGFHRVSSERDELALGLLALGVALIVFARQLAAVNSAGWARLLGTAFVQGFLSPLIMLGPGLISAQLHGNPTPLGLSPRKLGVILGALVAFSLLMAIAIRTVIAMAARNRWTWTGCDWRNSIPVDAGFGGWITLDKSKFELYCHSRPPRRIGFWRQIGREVRMDLDSIADAFFPLIGMGATFQGLYQGDLFAILLGTVILGLYAHTKWRVLRGLRRNELCVGTVTQLNDKVRSGSSVFLTNAQLADGSSISVLVDQCLAKSLLRAHGAVEVAAVCVPRAKLSWVISARAPAMKMAVPEPIHRN
jgi:hypothetical protein